ncbi:MAG: agmatinase [Proteobacteria bacterium]|nr:agmatinase [Pseudomonadota bacterium]MDA0897290.1 agmatinase [Pseudomonadota bacterium]MDA1245209.1 agmatinase [Pseudomonadota bacterium]
MEEYDQLAAPGYPVFLGSEFEHPAEVDALFQVIPIPYEASVSYGGGTAEGPKTILEASWQLEQWDGKSIPGQEGIFTHAPIDCSGDASGVIEAIARVTRRVIDRGQIPVGIGGEHTVTFGLIKGMLDAGERDFGVVQIDAHADLRDRYEDNPYSHASVMKRIVDEGIPLLQLGIRAICEEEMQTRKEFGVAFYDAEVLVPTNVSSVQLPEGFPKKIFFTVDVDGLDPSVFPSTGTPVPGGLGWYQTLGLIESVASQAEIIGFDLTEFAPIEGFHAYQFSASALLYKMMGIVQRSRQSA